MRPMGRDRAKKKVLASQARSEESSTDAPDLVALLIEKWSHEIKYIFCHKKEASTEYLRIKEQKLEMERLSLAQEAQLEKQRLAQRDKEFELQRQIFEFKQEATM